MQTQWGSMLIFYYLRFVNRKTIELCPYLRCHLFGNKFEQLQSKSLSNMLAFLRVLYMYYIPP